MKRLKKCITHLLLCTSLISFSALHMPVHAVEPTTLFYENFDDAKYGTAGSVEIVEPWVQEGSDESKVSTHNSIFKSAPNGVKIDKTDSMSTKISTAGYENIVVSFSYRCASINSGKAVVEYSVDDGANWTALFNIEVKTGGKWEDKEFALDATANDNSKLQLRIRTDSLNGNVYVDDIKVIGTAKGGSTPETAPSATPASVEAPATGGFSDVSGDLWAKPYIEDLTAKGVALPTAKGKFLPEASITRAEFTSLLVQALKIEGGTTGKVSFNDVKPGVWYESAVVSAVNAGVIKGFEDGTFKPEDPISRQDMAVIAASAMKIAKGIETASDEKEATIFTDNGKIGSYAKKAVATTVTYGVINGKPGKLFDPENKVTRAEAAKVISKLMGKLVPVVTEKPVDSEISSDDIAQVAKIGEDKTWYHDIPIGKGGDRTMKIDIVTPKERPKKPMPVLVFIYGGGWNKGTKDDHVNKIAGYVDKGYIGVAIEYRLTHETTFPGQIEDAKLAIRYLRGNAEKYFIDTERIGVWGSSAGSHIASLLGTTGDVKELEGMGGWQEYSSRVHAVIDWYGPADFTTEFANNYSSVTKLLGTNAFADPEKAKRAMPSTYASPDDPPFLVMHGDKDQTIPYYDSVAFAQSLKRAGVDVTFKIVKGVGHGFADFPEASAMAWDFLEKKLKNK